MVKRISVLISLACITSMINGMEEGTRSAGVWLNHTLNAINGVEKEVVSAAGSIATTVGNTTVTVEQEMESLGLAAEEEMKSLDSKMIFNAVVTYATIQTCKWVATSIWDAWIADHKADGDVMAALNAIEKSHALDDTVLQGKVNHYVDAKMNDILPTLAEKKAIDVAKKDVIETLTPLINGIGDRQAKAEKTMSESNGQLQTVVKDVATLKVSLAAAMSQLETVDKGLKGLNVIVNGDPSNKKSPGIIHAQEQFQEQFNNRLNGVENFLTSGGYKVSSSGSSSSKGGVSFNIFGRKKKEDHKDTNNNNNDNASASSDTKKRSNSAGSMTMSPLSSSSTSNSIAIVKHDDIGNNDDGNDNL